MSIKCNVRGCSRKLDENGRPVEYCDHNQGRCPMQKPGLNNKALFLIVASVMGCAIYTLCLIYNILCPA